MLAETGLQGGSVLAQLSQIEAGTRLHRLELEAPQPLLVERWWGDERLAADFDLWVDVLCTHATLRLEDWLGTRARLLTRRARGVDVARSGLVCEAACLVSDGGLARYRLRLCPWTWMLRQARHSRVFQERSVLEIIDLVLAPYQPLATCQHSAELAGFMADARPRSFCVQYRESDWTFVTRLLAEEGIGWRLQESAQAASGHLLVLFADSALQPQDPDSAASGGVAFHRSDPVETRDAVLVYARGERMGVGWLGLSSHDYRRARAIGPSLSCAEEACHPGLVYDAAGAYAVAGLGEGERYLRLHAEACRAATRTWRGRSTARSFRAGTWFALRESRHDAELLLTRVQHAGVNNLPVDARRGVDGALGRARAPLDLPEDVLADAEAVGYGNAFEAIDRERPWRPRLGDGTGMRFNPRPIAPAYQTAIVVGPEGGGAQEVHMDRLGRVRVRFGWQDGERADDRDTCWLRVAQRYAGPGVGSQFIPRVGQEVLVAFLEGDIDRPLVVGALYNGQGEAGVTPTPGGKHAESDLTPYALARDHRPSAQANQVAGGHAPPWHGMGAGADRHRNAAALSGVKSREWHGSGGSQLVFDDSDAQLRVQLATTQQASELNLGHLVHQADNYRGSFRGQGFELRTDAWGAVRAERGLWLSAWQPDGETDVGDANHTGRLMRQLVEAARDWSGLASRLGSLGLAASDGVDAASRGWLDHARAPLPALLRSVEARVDGDDATLARNQADDKSWRDRDEAGSGDGGPQVQHSGDPLLGVAAPAGVALVAGTSLGWTAGESLQFGSGGGCDFAVSGDARVHAGQAIGLTVGGQGDGLALGVISALGPLDLQARNDLLTLRSRARLRVGSVHSDVDIVGGKDIRLSTAGGASLVIEGGNLQVSCPGQLRVHASLKRFLGGTQLSREMNAWPEARYDDDYIVRHAITGEPLANVEIEIERADGALIRVVSDAEGRLPKQHSQWPEGVILRWVASHDGEAGAANHG